MSKVGLYESTAEKCNKERQWFRLPLLAATLPYSRSAAVSTKRFLLCNNNLPVTTMVMLMHVITGLKLASRNKGALTSDKRSC